MVADKAFDLRIDSRKVYISDIPIKGKSFVRAFLDSVGEGEWTIIDESNYQIIDDSIVFVTAPTGVYLVLQVVTTPIELTTTPNDSTLVLAMKDDIKTITANIGSVITVADNISGIMTISENIEEILEADENAIIATNKASEASDSAQLATNKASEASDSATTALTAKNSVEVAVEVLSEELSKGRYVYITYPNIFYNDTDSGIKFYYTENDISTSTFVSTLTAVTASEFVDKINSTSTITILGFSAVFSSPLGVDTIQLRHTYNKSITSIPYAYMVKDGVQNSMYPFANGAYSDVAITGQNISSVNTVALNIDEILQADTNASIATTKAAEANASVNVCQSIASGVLHLGALDLGLVSDTNTYFPTDLGGL